MQGIVYKNKKLKDIIPLLEKEYNKSVKDIITDYYLVKQYGIKKTSVELGISTNHVYGLLKLANIEPRKGMTIEQRRNVTEKIKNLFDTEPERRIKLSESRKRYYLNHPEAKKQAAKQLDINRSINNERLKTDEEYRNRQLSGLLEDAKKRVKLHKEELYDLYWNQKLDMKQIATKLNSHWTSVEIAMKKYGIPIRNKSEAHILSNKRPEIKTMLSERTKRYWQNPEYRKLKIEQSTGKNNPFYGKHHTEETKEKILKAVCSTPNKLESYIDSLLQKHFPNTFKYVGDASITIHGLSVDFISNDLSRVIEVFGDDWHSPDNAFGMEIPYVRTEEGRIHVLEKYGYKCLVLWQSDIEKSTEEQIVTKIREFCNT